MLFPFSAETYTHLPLKKDIQLYCTIGDNDLTHPLPEANVSNQTTVKMQIPAAILINCCLQLLSNRRIGLFLLAEELKDRLEGNRNFQFFDTYVKSLRLRFFPTGLVLKLKILHRGLPRRRFGAIHRFLGPLNYTLLQRFERDRFLEVHIFLGRQDLFVRDMPLMQSL